MKIILPSKVKYIIDKIYNSGYEAYIVGGCVRDSIINIEPNDFDITTNALPQIIKEIFKEHKCLDTGIEHGTVSILIGKEIFEVTTYRIEGEYRDHRRPDSVEFTRVLEEDLKRRDFTINSMAYNEKENLIDIFGGSADIKNKIIKTVGNPNERFNEDGLRMIRAIRFSSKLNFTIESNTLKAIYNNALIIKNISIERITEEFNKIILSDYPENIIHLFKTKLLNYLNISNENDEEILNKLEQELYIINKIEKDLIKRLVALDYIIKIYDIKCSNISNSLRYSKKINKTSNILLNLLTSIEISKLDKVKIKIILNEIGIDLFKTYLDISEVFLQNKNENIEKATNILRKIEENKECYNIKDLDINGKDIMNLGYKNEDIGLILKNLLDEVIKNPNMNKKKYLIEKINLM